jgi:hypothetical protein
MNERQQKIYEELLKKSGNPGKSRRKRLKGIAKRRARSEIRREKSEADRENSGKLYRENIGLGQDNSPEFTEASANRLVSEISGNLGLPEPQFLQFVRTRKAWYRDLLLGWSPEVPRDSRFWFLKGLLETYWDNPGDLLSYAKGNLERT